MPDRARPSRGFLLDAVLAALVFVAAIATYFSGLEETPFHRDESRWLNRAHYLTDLLDPFGPTWNDQYLTRGQPPIGSYVMGLGLLIQGQDLDTNQAWDFRRSPDFNSETGTYPAEADLLAGRRTNAVIGSIAAVVVYIVARMLTNRIGGVVGAALLIANPLQIWHNRLALADTTLTLSLALTLLAAILLFRRPRWTWAIALGILIGIGGANKLTPMALCAPLGLLGAWLLFRSWLDGRQLRTVRLRGWLGLPSYGHLGWMLVSIPAITAATFVVVYPYLWPNPLQRTLLLLEFRREEMANQARILPHFRVETPIEATQETWNNLGGPWSATNGFLRWIGFPELGAALGQLDTWLALAGLITLAIMGARRGLRSPHFVVWALIMTQTGTILLTMGTAFERYYLPIVLGFVVAAGAAVGAATGLVGRYLTRHSGEQALTTARRERGAIPRGSTTGSTDTA